MTVLVKESIKEAKTVAEAMKLAYEELGEYGDEVKTEVLVEPSKGFLGFGSRLAKVRVYIENEVEEVKEENLLSKEDAAVQYIKDVLTAMGAENFSVNASKEGENLNIALEGEDLGFVIGRRGETIDAIQYLTGLVVNRIDGDYLRVTIDSGNFREKREKTLEGLARRLAKTVVKTGRSITLEPMNPYERRIIHSTVSTIEGATSSSIGEEPNRKVVISSTNPRKPQSRDNRGGKRNYNRDGKGGERRNSGDKPFRKGGNRGGKKNFERKDRAPINNEVDTTPVTDVLPKNAESTPLYGKIEL
ncbi:MAG: protein jag [Oscillospiraceae bacterium]|nr:protein jag [Oscillospiraceae bacterium]